MRIIAFLLMTSPIIAAFIAYVITVGWLLTLMLFATAGFFICLVIAGVHLWVRHS